MDLFNIKSQNYYFINGLRRSGNHFFISWIISNYKRVLFINDIHSKPILNEKYHKKELTDKIIFREKNQFVDSINNNLISNKENITDLKEIDCLIFSMEDKKLDTFYKTIKYFDKIIHKGTVSKSFRAIVIRDLLNLMASRTEALKNISKNKNKNPLKVDQYIIDVWVSMYNDKKSVLFNYNKFILDYDGYREEIAKKLKLPVLSDDVLLKVPQFFFGSSFNPNSQSRSKIHDLLNRYKKHQSNKFILSIINNAKIMNILIKDFSINYKVAFMFLTINDIEYENMWNDYFNTEKDSINKFNIYLFSKYPAEIKSVFKYYIIKNKNKYSTIINNYKILFEEAIEDDLLNKYFIILQDTDIPKYKFKIFYKFLIEKVKENNTIELLKFNKGNFLENKKFNLIKHTPYSILNRKSIINILKSPYLKYFDYNKVADEYYLSLIYNKTNFKNTAVTYCDWNKYNTYQKYIRTKMYDYIEIFIKNNDIKYKKLSAKYHTFLDEYYRLDIVHEDLTSKVNKKNTFFERMIKHF